MATPNLTFGVEFECILPAGVSFDAAAQALNARGIDCRAESYNHQTRPQWKVVTDGSLGDYTRGAEFVSPVLRGDEGLAQVETVCETLQDLGCTVNRHCGTHIHIGARGLPLTFFKRIVRLYQIFEPVIDAMMPASRRASANSYCRSLTAIPASAIATADSISNLANAMRRHSGAMEARYHKVNLAAHDRHGTVEFRQHSGTLEYKKISNWILTCLRMVEFAKGTAALDSAATQPLRNQARPGTKAHKIGEMLLREEGVTGPEICHAMGWPSVSVPQQAQACGIPVTSIRMGRTVRYYAQRAAAEANPNLDTSLQGLCRLIGSTEQERNYLETRTANLRGAIAWAA